MESNKLMEIMYTMPRIYVVLVTFFTMTQSANHLPMQSQTAYLLCTSCVTTGCSFCIMVSDWLDVVVSGCCCPIRLFV